MKKVMIKHALTETVGWCGVLAIVGAYTLVSFQVIAADSLSYQLLNLTGGFGIIVTSLSKKDYEPVVLNVFWIAIASVAILTVIL